MENKQNILNEIRQQYNDNIALKFYNDVGILTNKKCFYGCTERINFEEFNETDNNCFKNCVSKHYSSAYLAKQYINDLFNN